MTFVAYFHRHWTYMHISTAILICLGIPSIFILHESVHWLAANGKIDQAEKNLYQMAKRNKKFLTTVQKQEMRSCLENIAGKKDSVQLQEEKLNPWDMFWSGYLVISTVLLLNGISVNLGTYSLLFNNANLNGDLFLNFVYTALFEFPGLLIIMGILKFIRRKVAFFVTQVILGVSCLVMTFIPKDQTTEILISFMIGKSASTGAFILAYLVTSEIYPTNLRSQGLGTCSMVARCFGLLAPFLSSFSEYWKPLPMVLLGILSLIAGALSLIFLPETKGVNLPEQINKKEETNFNRFKTQIK